MNQYGLAVKISKYSSTVVVEGIEAKDEGRWRKRDEWRRRNLQSTDGNLKDSGTQSFYQYAIATPPWKAEQLS
jgi:hypothetical protein